MLISKINLGHIAMEVADTNATFVSRCRDKSCPKRLQSFNNCCIYMDSFLFKAFWACMENVSESAQVLTFKILKILQVTKYTCGNNEKKLNWEQNFHRTRQIVPYNPTPHRLRLIQRTVSLLLTIRVIWTVRQSQQLTQKCHDND